MTNLEDKLKEKSFIKQISQKTNGRISFHHGGSFTDVDKEIWMIHTDLKIEHNN